MTPAPARIRLELFFDVLSPYTVLCWNTLKQYESLWDLDVKVSPFFLGGVMKMSGNKPPATVAAKGAYMVQDLERQAALFGVPLLQTPSNFFSEAARDVLKCQRTLIAAQQSPAVTDTQVTDLITAFMHGFHSDKSFRDEESNDIHVNESFVLECCKRVGLTEAVSKQLVASMDSPEVKAELRSNTERAVSQGAFGSPTMVVYPIASDEPMLFFGSDRFEQLAHAINKPYYGVQPNNNKAKL